MRSENWIKTDQPCPCGTSSDAYAIDGNEWGHCFRCGKNFPPSNDVKEEEGNNMTTVAEPVQGKSRKDAEAKIEKNWKFQYLDYRGVKKDVLEFLKIPTALDPDSGEPTLLQMKHPNGRVLNKRLDEKRFFWTGEKSDGAQETLFGQDIFAAGSSQAVTVTEGWVDGASVYQMFGKKYPVVAVTSAQSAKTECAKAYEYLNSFDKIYLCFDNDEPGQDAVKAVARLFDFNKVYIVNIPKGEMKDPNDYLRNNRSNEFQKVWWAAKRFLPEGILSSYADFDKIIDDDKEKPSIPYPFPRLQQMTYGIRSGEVVLLTAQEGIGKTEILRALEYHLLKTTDDNIGIIHLEENKARTVKGLVGYEVEAPIHLPDQSISKDEIKSVFRKLTKKDERVHLYSHFGSDDPDVILSTIRFLAGSCNCKYIFLDHITMVVTGLGGEDERRALDYISTRLAMMVEELDFTLFLVSHVNDQGQTRGSRNVGKIADLRINMHRNVESENDTERNTTYLMVSKNRYAGKTGPSMPLLFDPDTYILTEGDPNDVVPF